MIMRRMKKYLAMLLTAAMIFTMCGDCVLAAGTGADSPSSEVADGIGTESPSSEAADENIAENPNSEATDKNSPENSSSEVSETPEITEPETSDNDGSVDNALEDTKGETATGEEPSEGDKTSADEEPSTGDKTSADDELLTGEEPSEDNEPTASDNETTESDDESALINEAELEETAGLLLEVTGDSGEVSRIGWLSALTELFDMSVEKDNYPDNYYSDIDSSYEHYYEVMLATEFGLIDVEAGDALCPDDAASREFAAHTLNYCLGFVPTEEGYTYEESGSVTYPDDIQTAIDRGWFELTEGKFLPEQAITADEKEVMLADAKSVLDNEKNKPQSDNTYEFADGVIELPENIDAQLTDENEITIYQTGIDLKEGDKFAIVKNNLPSVFKAVQITEDTEKTVIKTQDLSMEESFKSLNISGSIDNELSEAQAYSDDIELSYIVGGTEENKWEDGVKYDSVEEAGDQEISALQASIDYAIPEDVQEEFELGNGVKATVTCTVSNIRTKYDASLSGFAYFDVYADVFFSCNLSVDVFEALGVSPTVDLIKIPIAYIGYFSLSCGLTIEGNLIVDYMENVMLGLHYDQSSGFRIAKSFTKEYFSINVRAKIDARMIYSLGFNVCNILKGSIYGRFGVKVDVQSKTYGDGKTPKNCTHVKSWFYATIGCNATIDLMVHKKTWSKSEDIYTEYNSPIRASFHYDDGEPVSKCGREEIKGSMWKYYTSADSRYGYNGASSGVDSSGQPYTIFKYSLDEYDNATITSYQGNVSALSIPGTLDGHKVVGIDSYVFQGNKQLRMVIIPDSVTEIGNCTFDSCTNLAQVILSKGLVSMGAGVFCNCDKIESIEIPKSLKSAGSWTSKGGPFGYCDGLKEVNFEEGTTEIATWLFSGCTGIEEINIPDTVTIIEYSAFIDCTKLKKVSIPNSVIKIESYAFENCSKLTEVNIPDSVTEIGNCTFDSCTNLAQVTLSKGLVSMGAGVFCNCDKIESIEIPKSLKSAGSWTSKGGPFGYCDGLKEVNFEEGTTEIATWLFSGCTGIEEINIPDTVTIIEDSAFIDCTNLKKVSIPNSVIKIGDYAFEGCSKLSEINIPDSMTEIGNRAFIDCLALPQIELPSSITNFGNYVFSGCAGLKEVKLPDNWTRIEDRTFYNCTNLEKINFPSSLKYIEGYAFYKTNLSEVILPDKVTEIETYAFYDCDALTKVVIPDSVTSLGSYIFADCELLSDVTLGTGITTISTYAFNLCPSLHKVILPYRVNKINANAFTNCTSLTEITIPRATTTIASGVFSYPDRLTIYGISGTYAEIYADSIGAKFVNNEVKATAVSLDRTELQLVRGAKSTLVLSIEPSDFTDAVSWKSSDEAVATIDDTGLVTAKSIGMTNIKVTVGELSASCKVTVVQPVTYISLNKSSLSLEAHESETLTVYVSPSDAENKEVEWSSSDENIASVDANGLVTAIAKGSATIRAEAKDGSGVYGSCNVTVVNNGYICSDVSELESEHNYGLNCSDFWLFTKAGAKQLSVTFDENTDIEEDFDFLYIYDGNGTEIGKYTGKSLAGKTVEITGDTVKIKLVSDDSGTAWGFKITSVTEKNEEGGSGDPGGNPGDNPSGGDSGNTDDNTDIIPEEDMPASGVIPDGLWIAGVKAQTYTGKALKPSVRVYDGKKKLKLGEDYTLSYKNNIKANYDFDPEYYTTSAPTVAIKGRGNYTGTASAAFIIEPIDIGSSPDISVDGITLGYNGKEQKKVPVLSFNGKKLSKNKDYTVSYPDYEFGAYEEIGVYTVTVEGVGNFTGSLDVNLEITDKKLIEKAKTVKIKDKVYDDGREIELSQSELIVYTKSKNAPLQKGIDYTVSYENNTDVGTATALIKGIGDYAGTKRVTFKIVGTPINKAVVGGIEYREYNGRSQYPDLSVKVNGQTLTIGKDYTVKYSDNVNVGNVKLTIKGIGAYSGTIKKSFKIVAYDLQKNSANLLSGLSDNITAKYTSGGSKPTLNLRFGDIELVEGRDYTLSYSNNKKLADIKGGSANKPPMITIKGKGNFKGKITKTFSIIKKSLDDADEPVKLLAADVAYVNKAGKYMSKPILTDVSGKKLKVGSDYEVKYYKYDKTGEAGEELTAGSIMDVNTDILVKVTGKGNYEGELTAVYRICEYNFAKAKISVAPQTYTGNPVMLNEYDISVKVGNNMLFYGEDFEIIKDSYVNNIKKGTASVQIKGLGAYGGVKTVKFKIQTKKMKNFSDIVRNN